MITATKKKSIVSQMCIEVRINRRWSKEVWSLWKMQHGEQKKDGLGLGERGCRQGGWSMKIFELAGPWMESLSMDKVG